MRESTSDTATLLQRLANIQVCEWEFRDILPALEKAGQKEIPISDFLRRCGQIQVCEWDIRTVLYSGKSAPVTTVKTPPKPDLRAISAQLKAFLHYVTTQLIDEPQRAQLKIVELGPTRLRFKLILTSKDLSMLVSLNGFTAAAIRSCVKAAGERHGIDVSLQIHTHEKEAKLLALEKNY